MEASSTNIKLDEGELREIALYAADCAQHVLPIFENDEPSDARQREAIDAAPTFAWCRRTAALRARAGAAYTAAAREAGSPAATDAARAASHAAAAAYLHPKASAHQVKHVLGAAAHAARAAELAAGGDPEVGAQYLRWAMQHTPAALRTVLRRYPPHRLAAAVSESSFASSIRLCAAQ